MNEHNPARSTMAWWDSDEGYLVVRPPSPGKDWRIQYNLAESERLQEQIMAAVNRGRLEADPFERWLETLSQLMEGGEPRYLIANGVWTRREGARKVWDAVQAAKEGR